MEHLVKSRLIKIIQVVSLVAALISISFSNFVRAESTEKYTIGIASFAMETCTFCPRRTDVSHFEHHGPSLVGDDVLKYPRPSATGFTHRMRQYPDFKVEGAYVTRWPVGGTGGSWITHRTFDKLTNELVAHLANMPKLDGIYLPLHGGMAVEGIPKPEAEIVRRIRERLGDIPIAITLDLHANEDHELTDAADIVLSVKRYPHYDYDLMGKRAADILVRTLRGDFKPVTETRKSGIIFASVYGATHKGIPQDVMERARRWENQYLDVFVSVLWGFAYADAEDGGATVIALTNNQPELARKIADDMNDFILKNKEKFEYPLPRPKQAISKSIKAVKAGKGPVILADLADRIGDSTHILRELKKRKVRNFALASIADSKAVSQIVENNKVGDQIKIEVGGQSTDLAGGPFLIDGSVAFIGKLNIGGAGVKVNVVALTFGDNNWVILTPSLYQARTPEIFNSTGVPIDEMDIIVVKSRVHFRRGFIETGLMKKAFLVDAPGHGPADISTLTYKNHPSGLYSRFFK